LKEWEDGTSQPTIRQAQILAKAYKRPFALFFLPEVPRDFQPLQDFRKSGSKELTTSSVFIIREIQQKQAWISDVYSEDNEEKLSVRW
jgi:transcriptional regulator with XRE-family HTH domain